MATMCLVTTSLRTAASAAAQLAEQRLVAIVATHALCGIVSAFLPSRAAVAALYGLLCNALTIALLWHAAPPLRSAIETSPLRLSPFLVHAVSRAVAAAAWLLYALALGDVYIMVPSILTGLLATSQAIGLAALTRTPPRTGSGSSASSDGGGSALSWILLPFSSLGGYVSASLLQLLHLLTLGVW